MKRKNLFFLLFAFASAVCFANISAADSPKGSHLYDTSYTVSKDSLLKIIRQQNENIAAYKSLKEEMTAKEVFEKSKSYLITWISIGGMAILFVILFGYFKIKDFIIGELKKKMVQEGTQLIQDESSRQIDTYIKENLHIDQIASEIESNGNEKLNELIAINRKSFDEFVEKKQKDFQDFLRQLEESKQILKGPLGEGVYEEKKAFAGSVPLNIDYSTQLNPVRNQGQLGSSVGFAMAYTMEYFILKQLNIKTILSPLFIYYQARKMAGTVKMDAGAIIHDVIKVGQTIGIVDEETWPYKESRFAVHPPKSIDKTTHYFVDDVASVKTLKQIKDALSVYGPVIIGVSIYSSFYTDSSAIMKMPGRKESIIGGHAICLVGFDEQTQLFKFKNCWGTEWGENGYGYIPYDYIEKFSADGWIIKKVRVKTIAIEP
jgi:C1A family cysteine protease